MFENTQLVIPQPCVWYQHASLSLTAKTGFGRISVSEGASCAKERQECGIKKDVERVINNSSIRKQRIQSNLSSSPLDSREKTTAETQSPCRCAASPMVSCKSL